MVKKWFMKGVMKRSPNSLGGWKKTQSTTTRRRNALGSRPKNWNLKTRYLSTGRALLALSNVTKDKRTKQLAALDARHFFNKLK